MDYVGNLHWYDVHDDNTLKLVHTEPKAHVSSINAVLMLKEGGLLAAGGNHGHVTCWNTADRTYFE
jgi:hypothetical protein